MSSEVAHYVVAAYPAGGVLCATKCNFLDPSIETFVIAKSQRLEFRSITKRDTESSSHVVLSLPINGRITNLFPIKLPKMEASLLFFMTETFHYAVIGSAPSQTPYPVQTLASGRVHPSLLGQRAEGSPRVAYHPYVMAMHLYDGFLTLVPIHASSYRLIWDHATKKGEGRMSSQQQLMGEPYHLRLEETHVLDLKFIENHDSYTSEKDSQQIALLHQDARGSQHVAVYTLRNRQLSLCWKKQRLDGASSKLLSLPPPTSAVATTTSGMTDEQKQQETGSIVVLGQRQITHLTPGKQSRAIALPQSLILSACRLNDGCFLLGDEFGHLHVLTITSQDMSLDTLGSSVLASALVYLNPNFIFCGSQLGDSQLLELNVNATPAISTAKEESNNSALSLMQEYTNLGPILDMDWVETTPHQHSVVTASGSSVSGSLRLVRNGIGMKEFASVELPGIQQMFNLRANYQDWHDTYLVQSYVTETRILGVATADANSKEEDDIMQDTEEEEEEEGATLEEVILPGLDSTSLSLYVGNVEQGNLILQITPHQVLLIDVVGGRGCVSTWNSDTDIAVAAANEAGQIVVALRGGILMYLQISLEGQEIKLLGERHLASEVSCLNVNSFSTKVSAVTAVTREETEARYSAESSSIVTVGLWDDFTVRVLKLDTELNQILEIHLSTDEEGESEAGGAENVLNSAPAVRRNRNNMMARSLCLVTLDSTSTNSSNHNGSTALQSSDGINMLFVGLGDGTLISFSVITRDDGMVSVQSKKEVSLGTQRIQLVPLETERGGTCVLATGDRPTVIYLAGGGGGTRHAYTPKLCYSNVNVSSPNPTSEEETDLEPQQLTERSIAVNVATPFVSPQLFEDSSSINNQNNSSSSKHYSLCVSDDAVLRLGVIDDIQKLHVTACRLGMAPRRVVHYERLFCVGCIESGITPSSDDETNMGNCVRFLDDATLDDVERIDMEPHEMILSMAGVELATSSLGSSSSDATSHITKSFLVVGTAYVLPDEDEPTSGRILLFSSSVDPHHDALRQEVKLVTELQVRGGVYSICQFYDGLLLVTVNSKTRVCRLTSEGPSYRIEFLGVGHHGHILSLMVKSRAQKQPPVTQLDTTQSNKMDDATPIKKKKKSNFVKEEEQLAIVGDLMRSISLVQYYPDHKALEEVARDFHSNWTTAVEMLTDSLYLGAENWNNLYILRRNTKATSEEIKCRLDTVGQYHLGESVNKFISGSLTMAQASSASSVSASSGGGITRRGSPSKMISKDSSLSTSSSPLRVRRPVVKIGSQTLFATVDGTLGSILGLDARTAAFFTTMERAMAKHVTPVGNLSHAEFRTFSVEQRIHPAQGFVDGDLVESFLDMDRKTMQIIVQAMNRDGGWEIEQHDPNKKLENEDDSADLESSNSNQQQQQQLLSVEDVVAMVEEMTMFH